MTTQSSPLSRFAAVIGLDWSDRKHDVCLQCAGQQRREFGVLEHSVEAIDTGALGLRKRFAGRRIAIALELEQGPIVSALRQFDFIVLFPSIQRWPTLKSVRQARRATLENFFHEHNVRRPALIAQRIDAIRKAQTLTEDEGVVAPFSLLVSALIEQLRVTINTVESFDRDIARRARVHPDFGIFDSFPAAGPVIAPRLLTAFGEQRERDPMAADRQRYAGVAPVTERSGNSHWVHWRWSCPIFLRQTFVEWAALTIPRSFWAGAFHRQQRAAGKTHQAALRSLAYKWIRILHRCWIDRKPYDETIYLSSLKERGSPLLAFMAA